jgi:hypothetical protein
LNLFENDKRIGIKYNHNKVLVISIAEGMDTTVGESEKIYSEQAKARDNWEVQSSGYT